MSLRFEPKPGRAPRDYFSRGEQLRLLAMVAALGAVVLVMGQLRRPQTAAALDRMFGGGPAVAQAQNGAPSSQSDGANRQWLRPDLLSTIRDNTPFRDAESEAWFAVIEELMASPNPLGSPDARTPLSYAQLLKQPDVYRGKPVTVAGTIRRVEKVTPAANDLGLNHYFRVVIRPEGREVWPIFVYALERPDGVPLDEPVNRAMSARGVFFKNLSYRSESGMGVAPVVLARGVRVAPLPPPTSPSPVVTPLAVMQVVLVAGGIAAAAVLFLWLRRPTPARAASRSGADLDFDRLARDASPPRDQP